MDMKKILHEVKQDEQAIIEEQVKMEAVEVLEPTEDEKILTLNTELVNAMNKSGLSISVMRLVIKELSEQVNAMHGQKISEIMSKQKR